MSSSSLWVFGVGVIAQLLFAARMIIQWVSSEKAGKPISPLIFWQLSILGSIIFLIYGILRHDFVIVLGQVMVYFIYLRNMHLLRNWEPLPLLFKLFILIAPLLSVGYLIIGTDENIFLLLSNQEISLPLKIWGSVGQVIFTIRFYIQWIDSESKGESVFSRLFWLVSLVGSLMIITYAAFRLDPVLLTGQLTGVVVYSRNLMLGKANRQNV